MQYRILRDADEKSLRQIARVHCESLAHLSFLAQLGPSFIFHVYRLILDQKLGFFAIAVDGEDIAGFAFLSLDNSKLMPAMLRRPLRFAVLAIPALIRRPGIAIKMAKSFAYFRESDSTTSHIKGEFLAQVTRKGLTSTGIGTSIIDVFEREYLRLGITEYKFAIAQENTSSVNFFKKRGFEVVDTYDFSGTIWNIYVKHLSGRTR